jgi:hypothetical protein
MWRSTSSVSSRSSLPPDIVNSEQLSFESDNSFNFDKWNIPKISNKDIYTYFLVEIYPGNLNILLELLNKHLLFLVIIQHFSYLIKDLLMIQKIKNTSFCMLDLSKLLLNL